VYAACGAEHVQQLVIHWMAMGTLDYPFARAHSEAKKQSLASIVLALISALGGQKRSVRAEEREEEATLALT
jgi:hypothetical protein